MTFGRLFFYYFMSVALFISSLSITAFLVVLEGPWYEILFMKQLFTIPLGLFVVGGSFILALIFSLLLNATVKGKLGGIEASLWELANGNILEPTRKESDMMQVAEMKKHIHRIQQRLKEQVLLSQKMAEERAKSSEQMMQAVVSKERNRLARELHDSVSQQLFAASMLLAAINQQQDKLSDQTKQQLQLVEGMVTEAQSEMRALLLHLRPVQLDGKSLQVGIKELLEEICAKHDMEMIWDLDDVILTKGVEDHLFRIIQEALSNTLRHAKATVFEVKLKKINEFILLKVVDNGIGFEIEQHKVGSYGLKNIEERVSEIAGTLKMISLPGKGTSIEVKVPIIY